MQGARCELRYKIQNQSAGLPVYQSASQRKTKKNTKDARCELQGASKETKYKERYKIKR
jgi:hypothetical protein